MSDQDNLRDRIAAQITPFLYWNYADWEDADERDKADARECAQAIIDELGLTKEWQPVSRQILNDGTAIENPTQSRIVGKWEPECHR